MQIDYNRTLHISLHGNEVDAMLNVAAMARLYLDSLPVVPMRGCPLIRKGDLLGNDLNNVETLLDRILED